MMLGQLQGLMDQDLIGFDISVVILSVFGDSVIICPALSRNGESGNGESMTGESTTGFSKCGGFNIGFPGTGTSEAGAKVSFAVPSAVGFFRGHSRILYSMSYYYLIKCRHTQSVCMK